MCREKVVEKLRINKAHDYFAASQNQHVKIVPPPIVPTSPPTSPSPHQSTPCQHRLYPTPEEFTPVVPVYEVPL